MKFRICTLLSINVLALCAIACGPYVPIIPTPNFFVIDKDKNTIDYEREENLHLWQELTSRRIPLDDIERAVYKDSRNSVCDYLDKPSSARNQFYTYLDNTDDVEIQYFLLLAKEMEERWRQTRSPWYYPQSRTEEYSSGDFHDIVERCEEYEGERLRDRYALQAVRAIFASRCFAECIEYCDSAFADIPDSNLMKRMAMRYAAGSWKRLGHTEKADSLFAVCGDVYSISNKNGLEFMARLNPNAPKMMEYVRSIADDSARASQIVPVAQRLLRSPLVKNKGDWEFFLSHYYYELENKPKEALRHVYRALGSSFSTAELHDLARAYKMKLEAHTGATQPLVADMTWMERKCDVLNPDAKEWVRRIKNILYQDWIPQLWKKHSYAKAIMLAAYADNLEPKLNWRDTRTKNSGETIDYCSLSFQMMGSLSSAQLAQAYAQMQEDTPLFNFLRKSVSTDSNYYNELIGTLALREEDYARAITYLSAVSQKYQRGMNIYSYLSRDPFARYPSRWEKYSFPGEDECWENEYQVSIGNTCSPKNAKLNFAKRMLAYRNEMSNGETADKRAHARLMYAIGRRNSLEECWALTQYWRGAYVGLFVPELDYWAEDGFLLNHYAFLFDYERTVGHKATEARYEEDVKSALSMFESAEARAKAEYLLGNLATVVKQYGETTTASFVRTSCDNWRSWL